MGYTPIFKCVSSNHERIPIEVAEKFEFPSVHTDSNLIALLSKGIKEYRNDSICKLPFCTTVEAEAMGGIINLGDKNTGPRVCDYLIKNIDDINKVNGIDLSKGRISEVLKAAQHLKDTGELVCLNVTGPFTIANSLMDSSLFYKALRKDKEKIQPLLQLIEESILDYIIEAVKIGVDIISYADPTGTIDIVGPKVYRDLSGRITYNILKKIEGKLKGTIVHICGKTSTSLESIGLAEARAIMTNIDSPYDKVLCNIVNEENDIRFLGHWCVNIRQCKNVVEIKLK